MPSDLSQLLTTVIQWASAQVWLPWLVGFSVLMLVATPLLLPLWVASLPADYFAARPRPRPVGAWQWTRRLAAHTLGCLLIVAGVLMLFLPGQGLLTLFAGLSLVPFPGKRALMRRVLARRGVARGLQWMRRRANREPLQLPGAADARG